MSIDLLDTPLRVTWDLHGPEGPMPSDAVRLVARELAAAGVFFVTLDRRPLLHPALGDILQDLRAGGVQTLIVAGGGEELACLRPGLPLNTLLLDLQPHLGPDPSDLSALRRAVATTREKGYEPALWLVPRRDNLPFLPALLAFAREERIVRIKLSNTPVDDTFLPSSGALLPLPGDLGRLKNLLGEDPLSLHAGLALEVHDLFLWELLFPGRQEGRSEYGGCQAANSLGHVDSIGDVHPCSSWPRRLGSLLKTTLADIWESPARHGVRAEIAAVPAECAGCRDYPLCLGGCRGLARCFVADGSGRDPLCGAPRK